MQQAGIAANRGERVTVLSVSPLEDDHVSLQTIISHSIWRLFKADCHASAFSVMRQHHVAVVLCERDLNPGWADMLHDMSELPQPPSMIVTSRFADESLWAEALNLGAWDVLSKPFDRIAVLRSVKAAWQHWHGRITSPVGAEKVMRDAS